MLHFSMVLLIHFKEIVVENRTADQTKGFPVSPVSAGLVVVAAVTQHTGGAQSCPVLDLPFSLCSGGHDVCHYRTHCYLEKPCVLS